MPDLFVGLADGWLPPDTRDLSAEAIRDHFDEIRNISSFSEPVSAWDEIAAIGARLT
jgi:hypothetical protein